MAADFEKGLAAYEKGDFTAALAECKPLAEQGHAKAQVLLGRLYQQGKGIEQDYKEAAKWYQLAAAQGDALAQATLGAFYGEGLGVEKNLTEASKWFRLAAAQESATAQYNLAMNYAAGLGIEQDPLRAHMWMHLAAKQGLKHAEEMLAKFNEASTPTQNKEALELAEKCLSSGYKDC